MSPATLCSPSSCLDELHRRKNRPLRAADAKTRRPRRHRFRERLDLRIAEHRRGVRVRRGVAEQLVGMQLEKSLDALGDDRRRIFARHRQHVLAADLGLDIAPAQNGVQRLLDEFRLAFLDHEDRLLVGREGGDLVVDQRISDVEHVDRHGSLAIDVGQTKLLQRAHHRIVEAALHDDADIGRFRSEKFVELALLDEFDGGRPALLDLFPLVEIGGGRQHHAFGIAPRVLQRLAQRESSAACCPWR